MSQKRKTLTNQLDQLWPLFRKMLLLHVKMLSKSNKLRIVNASRVCNEQNFVSILFVVFVQSSGSTVVEHSLFALFRTISTFKWLHLSVRARSFFTYATHSMLFSSLLKWHNLSCFVWLLAAPAAHCIRKIKLICCDKFMCVAMCQQLVCFLR